MKIAIKQDLSLDLNPFDYAIWGILENKANATFHPNISSFKTAVEQECNKLSEEFILKECKLFQKCVDTIIENMVAILSKFTVLCSYPYFVYFFKLKFNLVL